MRNFNILKHRDVNLALWLAFLSTFVSGQEARNNEEALMIQTNMVFVDVLVMDTENPIQAPGLERDDLKLFADGKHLEIPTFANAGFEKCPLTLALYLNLAPNGALQYLNQAKPQKSLNEMLRAFEESGEIVAIEVEAFFSAEMWNRPRATSGKNDG
jgi:hypothetical protein